jgi:release factor glutamine methyltransferase
MAVSYSTLRSFREEVYRELSDLYLQREIKFIVDDLASNVLNYSSSDLILKSDQVLSEDEIVTLNNCIDRLKNKEPLQYITSAVEFFGLHLKADSRALIPRPETEELVKWVLDENDASPQVVLDVCAGSGCIALAIKSNLRNSEVVAIELSSEAIELIAENQSKTNLDIGILQADVLQEGSFSSYKDESIDIIVSNPPYVLESDKGQMTHQVLDFEPHMALFVDDSDPLIFYRAIGLQAYRLLKKGGKIYFEVHELLAEEVAKLLEQIGFVNIEVRKDLQGKQRMVRGIR